MMDLESNALASTATAGPDELRPAKADRLFNRELSWLEFNRRVLDEAMDGRRPLFERLKFLSIFSTNLDEFFMIRVSGLMQQRVEGISKLSPDGLTPAEQIEEIRRRLRPMLKSQAKCLRKQILPGLANAGISIEGYGFLTAREQRRLDKYFRANILPLLTPQVVDRGKPFPYVSNLSLNLGLVIQPDRSVPNESKRPNRGKRLVRIKLPGGPRLVPIGKGNRRFVLAEDVISANIGELFPGMKAGEAFLFRVTRDAEIELRQDEADDLLSTLERELRRRHDRFPVRLEVAGAMPGKMVKRLAKGIGLCNDDVETIDGFINIPDLMQLFDLARPDLKDEPFTAVFPKDLLGPANFFDILRHRDILLHHPFTSFGAVTDLIAQAAEDQHVQAIKMCLYRTGKDSQIVDSLIQASRRGKQVTALVELMARFDEENNIEWAKRLENEGVQVVYGIRGLKTHGKVLLIVRREQDNLTSYVHISTGNYNRITAGAYTDIGLLTANQEIASDAAGLFNFLTGYSRQDDHKRLIISPLHLRQRLISLIRREARNKLTGRPARIIIKANSLTDVEVIEELYSASRAGVDIDLIIRGICCLRPGVTGLSENIRVRSIVGRFLEHSRVYSFANGGDAEDLYIGSSDVMQRNFDRRVEVLVPVLDGEIRRYLTDTVLDAYLRDEANARILMPDGSYKMVVERGQGGFDSQAFFIGLDTP
ncbi:MAG: polyphosphate kinase 1 [Pyrinomonadaceae bacterium]|nr:polyphosphate kinase 1 [Pyrinomonadaceae bacterium]